MTRLILDRVKQHSNVKKIDYMSPLPFPFHWPNDKGLWRSGNLFPCSSECCETLSVAKNSQDSQAPSADPVPIPRFA